MVAGFLKREPMTDSIIVPSARCFAISDELLHHQVDDDLEESDGCDIAPAEIDHLVHAEPGKNRSQERKDREDPGHLCQVHDDAEPCREAQAEGKKHRRKE